jgi:FkbM family methyltransferase
MARAGGGEIVYNLLPDDLRPRVLGFLDTFKSGELIGLPVLVAEEILPMAQEGTVVILASVYETDMCDVVQRFMGEGAELYSMWDYIEAQTYTYGLDELSAAQSKCDKILNGLEDEASKELYASLFKTRSLPEEVKTPYDLEAEEAYRSHMITKYGGEEYLALACQDIYFDYINFEHVKIIVEGGMFDGFNTYQFLPIIEGWGKIYSFEPNVEVLLETLSNDVRKGRYLRTLTNHPNVEIIDQALWSKEEVLQFGGTGAADTHQLMASGGQEVQAISIDGFVQQHQLERLDLIKLDIEGAEPACLEGAQESLKKFRPQLALSIYHTKEQFLDIPLSLMTKVDDYAFFIGHYCTVPRYDTVLYAIPREKL